MEVLETQKIVVGPEHPDTLLSMRPALMYYEQAGLHTPSSRTQQRPSSQRWRTDAAPDRPLRRPSSCWKRYDTRREWLPSYDAMDLCAQGGGRRRDGRPLCQAGSRNPERCGGQAVPTRGKLRPPHPQDDRSRIPTHQVVDSRPRGGQSRRYPPRALLPGWYDSKGPTGGTKGDCEPVLPAPSGHASIGREGQRRPVER